MFAVTHHGYKRHAEEEQEGEQPITKRLARMRIGKDEQNGVLPHASAHYAIPHHPQPTISAPAPIPYRASTDELMPLDDTKDKVYIHDLESEIAQIEAEELKCLFLPDIDRKISAIPQQLLRCHTNNANTQMVLYQVPSSISVPEEQDHVRKAIIATRARAREKQAREAEETQKKIEEHVHDDHMNGLVTDRVEEQPEDFDPDAMDLG
ncbi:hypothetical protein EPUS_07780 [Endocarpon pusillum Z07020]|uniref:Uncharacterized protein n=1 Tax=Endocarpon pusillum (strain Z07020 / HMAS-L-300199) TaxID=1263415 RepID=U1GG65_ENDPU|nr:uncharacterized protein EPUS_07780 [Endocarpon pusillum Z07020]ERF71108.1 hypothetical protein EPUS_07780 [Endocarpon pusillum Z07020]